jgi:hypothetical protein
VTDPALLTDPVALCKGMWPHAYFPSKLQDVVWAVKTSVRTLVVAGNQLGKDWVLGRICLSFWHSPWTYFDPGYFREVDQREEVRLLARMRGCRVRDLPEYEVHKRRIVTTSVAAEHLDVLWGEIGNAWRTCSVDLSRRYVMHAQEVRFLDEREATGTNVNSYLTAKVSGADNMEGLTGHHAPYALACGDESSGLDRRVFEAFEKWAKREVYIGNPKPCNNPYKTEYLKGDLPVGAPSRN